MVGVRALVRGRRNSPLLCHSVGPGRGAGRLARPRGRVWEQQVRPQGGGSRETFTVRKVSFGVGVERTFPVHTPVIETIKVVTRGDVRRAKLYYLRELRGKKAKIKEKRSVVPSKAAATTAPIDPAATPAPPTASPSAPADA